MRTIWTFIDEAGGAATNVTSHNGVCGQSELPTTRTEHCTTSRNPKFRLLRRSNSRFELLWDLSYEPAFMLCASLISRLLPWLRESPSQYCLPLLHWPRGRRRSLKVHSREFIARVIDLRTVL